MVGAALTAVERTQRAEVDADPEAPGSGAITRVKPRGDSSTQPVPSSIDQYGVQRTRTRIAPGASAIER